MSTPISYLLSYDVDGAVAEHPVDQLAGEYLTEARLDRAEFIVLALSGSEAVGLIIGERPAGTPARNWIRHVGDVLELGALFVDPAWRRTAVARRLGEYALAEARALRKIPVAVTETGSVAYRALAASGAQARKPFGVGGRQYTPWTLA